MLLSGGIISLAIAMSDSHKTLEHMVTFFAEASTDTFEKSRTGRFDPGNLAAKLAVALRVNDSVFSADPLERATKEFFGEDTSLFAPAVKGRRDQTATRVAVTCAKDYGDTNCLISNYNHPRGDNEEREENAGMDMKAWEAALATSAAPFYLPPFVKKETNTIYIDGAVYANCPAEVAYTEMKAIWPDHGASLDVLLSIGTGMQKKRDKNVGRYGGIVATLRNMLERQMDSNESWLNFAERNAPSSIRCKLRRLNPPLQPIHNEARVELHHYKKISQLTRDVEEWANNDGQIEVQEIANTLMANLFFFEPEDGPLSANEGRLTNPDHDVLPGSVRCRLPHGSVSLRKLLEEKAESFWSAEVDSPCTKTLSELPKYIWRRIEQPPGGSDRLMDMTIFEDGVHKFRLTHTFKAPKSTSRFQVIAVKLNGCDKKIAISGFPSTLTDLQKRAKLKWLL